MLYRPPSPGAKSCPRSDRLFNVPTNPRILNTDGTSPHRTLFVWGRSRSRPWAEVFFLFFFSSLRAVMSSATASRDFRVPLKHTQPHTHTEQQLFPGRCGRRHLHCYALICILPIFHMNKCRLKDELERKTNTGQTRGCWKGGSLGKFSAVLFLSARLQKTAPERGSGVGRALELWKGRDTTRGRGRIYLASGRQKNRQKVRRREKRRLSYCGPGQGGQTLCI